MSWTQLSLILCIGSSPLAPVDLIAVSGVHAEPEVAATASDEGLEEAEEHRLAAIKAFEAGDLEVAIREFEAARALDPDPSYIFNIGRVYEEKGDLAKALELYEEFVRAPRVELEEREAAQERADRLRKILEPAEGETRPQPEDDPPDGSVDDRYSSRVRCRERQSPSASAADF